MSESSKYTEFASFLDSILTGEESKANGLSLAVNFRDMYHPDIAIREALGAPEVIDVLKKHGMKIFIPEGSTRANKIIGDYQQTKNEDIIKKHWAPSPYYPNDPEKAQALTDAHAEMLITPLKAGINVRFVDGRYIKETPIEEEYLNLTSGFPAQECYKLFDVTARAYLKMEGKSLDKDKLNKKGYSDDVLHVNAIDTANAASPATGQENFYTLQGARHSDSVTGNPVIFAQKRIPCRRHCACARRQSPSRFSSP